MRKLFSLIIVLLLVSLAVAQSPTDRVIAEALKPSPLGDNLERLTDQIGGRMPGTRAFHAAVQWGMDAFKAAGADSVHTEDFPIPAAWSEGDTEMSVVSPERFNVHLVSVSWAAALPERHSVRVVDVGMGSDQDFTKAGDVSGALVLVHSKTTKTWDDLFAEYIDANTAVRNAMNHKALALALESSRPHDLLYRHSNTSDGQIDPLPQVLVAREDAERMFRLLAAGQKLAVDISIPNHIDGAITASNVVAELRGYDKPDEFVVLGAHLDSWELGTGALDNGCNAALVVDALRAIKDSHVRLKRSIRFILFSGEEEGLIGSHAYVVAHRNELDKAVAAIIFDSGIGKVTGFSLGGRKDIEAAATNLAEPLKQFSANVMTVDASYGSDHFDFMLEGVPSLLANQEEDNYLINYHAMSDTFDKVDLVRLKTHVADAAGMTFAIANATERLGPRIHRAQIEQTMKETHLDDQMKGFNIWEDWANSKRGRRD